MGIQGLLPFVKKASRQVNIRSFSGSTVAVDVYCWLHKGAFSCAEKIAKGEKTDGHIRYCMKFVNMLYSSGIKPILVFDGKNLPSKKITETKRRESREINRKKGIQFLREGKTKEARECFQRCVDITPDMALELIETCRKQHVDCIVAPYEADAQLAYLSKCGIADIVITEDSDLLLFGCEQIIYKMDLNGQGVMVEQSRIYQCMRLTSSAFTFEKFRYMCVLSGCDYLPSLPGIGLARACKVFSRVSNSDPSAVLPKLPMLLNMPTLNVSQEYRESFTKAVNTFMYQLVFCPLQKKLVPLNPYPPEINPKELTYAGEYFPDEIAYQIAIGNVNIQTMKQVRNFDPSILDDSRAKQGVQGKENVHKSIWDKDFCVSKRSRCVEKESPVKSTFGKEVVVDSSRILKQLSPSERKKSSPPAACGLSTKMLEVDKRTMLNSYLPESPPSPKKAKLDIVQSAADLPEDCKEVDDATEVLSSPESRNAFDASTRMRIADSQEDSDEADKIVEVASTPKARNIFKVKATPQSAQQNGTVRSRFFSTATSSVPPCKKSLSWIDEIDAQYRIERQEVTESIVTRVTKDNASTLLLLERSLQDDPLDRSIHFKSNTNEKEASHKTLSQKLLAFQWTTLATSRTPSPSIAVKNSVATQNQFRSLATSQDNDQTASPSPTGATNLSQISNSSCDLHISQPLNDLSESPGFAECPTTVNDEIDAGSGEQSPLEAADICVRTTKASSPEAQNIQEENARHVPNLGFDKRKFSNSLGKLGKCRGAGLSKKLRKPPSSKGNPISTNQQSIKDMLENFKFTKHHK